MLFDEYKKEKEEPFVLELITSIIETKKPKSTIEAVISFAQQKNDHKLATKLQEVISFIDLGETYIDSFYFANMLTDETYSIFNLADAKKALNRDMIVERVNDKETLRQIAKMISSTMLQPFILIFFAVGANIFVVTKFIPILKSFYKQDHMQPPTDMQPFIFAYYHPFLGFLALLAIMYVLIFILIHVIKSKTGQQELALYKMSMTIKNLKNIGLSYEQIFLEMYESEKNKKMAYIFYDIYVTVSQSSITQALEPIFEKLPITLAVVIFEKISKNDDIQAWEFAKIRLKEESFAKVETFAKILPFVGQVSIFLVISIAMIPIGALFSMAMSMG